MVGVRHHSLPLLHKVLLRLGHVLLLKHNLMFQHFTLPHQVLILLGVDPVLFAQVEHELHHMVDSVVVALLRLGFKFICKNSFPIHFAELVSDRSGVGHDRLQYLDPITAFPVFHL